MRREQRRLVDVGQIRRRTTKELVHVAVDRCPRCGHAPLDEQVVSEAALLRHGGYGATRTSRTLACPSCPWWLTTDVTETRP